MSDTRTSMPLRSRQRFGLRHARQCVVGLAICCTFGPARAFASEECPSSPLGRAGAAITLRVDNDLFGGREQDQGYSNGLQISSVSPNIADYRNDPCLPWGARRLNRYLDWLQPGGYGQRNMVMSLHHALYTPNEKEPRELLRDDRPYAAALLLSVGYNARQEDSLRAGHIRVGVVGPAAFGEEIQNAWHDFIGAERFNGWRNQLRNEPVVQLIHERMRRHSLTGQSSGRSKLEQDVIFHGGGALGNFGTYANAGLEWRWGWRIPDDFGSAPLRPAGENSAPLQARLPEHEWNGHLFVNLDARWVLRDITLDGNTFKDSHSVEKKPLVADVGYGVVFNAGAWKFGFARYFRTREFHGQRERPVYGSFTISRRLR